MEKEMEALEHIQKLAAEAKKYNERRMVVLAGSREKSFHILFSFLADYNGKIALLSSLEMKFNGIDCFHLKDSSKLLGTTYDILILDIYHSLQPSDVGKLYGIVKGGGLIFLITPKLEEWKEMVNRYHLRLLTPPYKEKDIRKNFIPWFVEKLKQHNGIAIIEDGIVIKSGLYKSKKEKRKKPVLPEKREFNDIAYKVAITQDQVDFIKCLEEMIEKPNPTTAVVLKANRGRGKSSAIGIALPALIEKLLEYKKSMYVMLVAPDIKNVQEIFKFAELVWKKMGQKPNKRKAGGDAVALHLNNVTIEYFKPLNAIEKYADLIVVDEAASIPPNILLNFTKNSNRIIYSSTVHGYEGAGRSFSIRFLKRLKSMNIKLIEFEMEEPIRYSKYDPIEKWAFDTLLLDAEAAEVKEVDLSKVVYEKIQMENILQQEEKLRQFFGILILAHYKNNPNDLAILCDAPNQMARALSYEGKIICSMQLALEGNMSKEDCHRLYYESSMIPGNVLPQIMIRHYRKKKLGQYKGMRVVRIAVHPDLFRHGIGSKALENVIEEARGMQLDYVGASFGATVSLLKFWMKNGFLPMHMTTSMNEVSAEYSVAVIKPLNEKFEKELREMRKEFMKRFMYWLIEPLRDLNSRVALMILDSYEGEEIDLGIDEKELSRLLAYIWKAGLTYKTVKDCLFKLSYNFFLSNRKKILNEEERLLLLTKNLQCKSWDRVANIMGKNEEKCKEMLIEVVKKIVNEFYGDKDEVLEFQKEVQKFAERREESSNA
ncbi:MAG: tRNA(Met) cytidine acetyltransferase [Thermoplasmata archaeon]|nr:MAG: tRNA(Met) cytidine acetyltransferase [Thermoplasmata archaeon]HDN95861.1 tRNA(Met) cytidine acetyltransferase [Thermoplasmatales archaeon]